jgi:CRISPR system Cascade subunit CasA
MTFNLLVEPVVPVRLRGGGRRWSTVADLVADVSDDGDYAVEPDWPRPDLNIATYEFLIGVLSVSLAPKSDRDWRAHWRKPPTPDELQAAFAPLLPAFNLDGDGPRFMQEQGLEGEANPIESLLIDTPGVNGQKKNADLLTHRDRFDALSLPATAIALYAMQSFAPSGGAGIRTSLRGGGPLTALVIPAAREGSPPVPLWRKLWANVDVRLDPPQPLAEIFPWLKDTPPSRDAVVNEKELGRDLHAFFGTPRRIWLIFGGEEARCAMTGQVGPIATGFLQRPSGNNYGVWQHPLTPYRREKPAGELYSMKPKAGRFGYRDWIAATLGDGEPASASLRLPAIAVRTARTDRRGSLHEDWTQPDARIRVAGWAMNNMEAITYLLAEDPLHLAPETIDAFDADNLARTMARAGDMVHGALRGALRQALFSEGDKPSWDNGVFREARDAFYEDTDFAFHEVLAKTLARATEGAPPDTGAAGAAWLGVLRSCALDVFDTKAPAPVDDAQKAVRVVKARGRLVLTLSGWGKEGGPLFDTLGLPKPEKREKKKREVGA